MQIIKPETLIEEGVPFHFEGLNLNSVKDYHLVQRFENLININIFENIAAIEEFDIEIQYSRKRDNKSIDLEYNINFNDGRPISSIRISQVFKIADYAEGSIKARGYIIRDALLAFTVANFIGPGFQESEIGKWTNSVVTMSLNHIAAHLDELVQNAAKSLEGNSQRDNDGTMIVTQLALPPNPRFIPNGDDEAFY